MRELSRYHAAVEVIEDQANDGRLWCVAETVMEDTLQRELRRLHAAIEGVSPEGGKRIQTMPSFHIVQNRANGATVLFSRHELTPHDVVERIEIPRAKLREVGEALIETANALDAVERAI